MAFAAVQFEDDNGPPALVNSGWLTPRRREVFWPPFKKQHLFDEAVRTQPHPDEAWGLHSIKRIYFKSDDYESARKKLNKLEDNFYDHHSSDDDSKLLNKANKRRILKRKLSESDNDNEVKDSDDESSLKIIKCETDSESSSLEAKESAILSRLTTLLQTPNLSRVTTSSPSFNAQPTSPTSIFFSDGHLLADTVGSSTTLPEFQEKVLKILQHVKEQNSQILLILRTQSNTNCVPLHLPDDLPFKLPLSSEIDLQKLEEYITDKDNFSLMLNYLSSFGGSNLTSQTNNILKRILKTQFACSFSFYGRKGKSAFNDFKLRSLVVDAVKVNSPNATENKIENAIKTWLKQSPQRLKMQCMKQSRE